MLTLQMIKEAQKRLKGVVRDTDLVPCPIFTRNQNNEFYIKAENLQKTGAFKIRGAYNKIASLSPEEREKGVIAASAGNHAQGVALAAKTFGTKAVIVMPEGAPLAKISATREYGAEVVLYGNVYDDACTKAVEMQKSTGAVFIHPFDDPYVIAGQGTIGLEILEHMPNVDVVISPVGGGGLISGIAVAIKEQKPTVQVIGVEPENAASMDASLKTGKIVTLASASTIADGIAVKTPGKITFELCRKYVDDIVTIDEDEIASTILTLLEKAKIVSEGAGAAAVAALAYEKVNLKNKKVVAILSGGNIDVTMLERIINRGLVKAGRKVEMQTMVVDKPGQLQRLLETISQAGANIISIHHDRAREEVALGYALVELVLETHDQQHIYTILEALKKKGYKPIL